MKTVDMPESPDISPDGKHARLRRRCATPSPTSSSIDLETGDDHEPHQRRVRRLRADLGARRQVDRLPRARQRQRQAVPPRPGDAARRRSSPSARTTTAAAQFLDADTLVFPSTAIDPNQPIEPEVARNGNIYNIWTLNLKTGELKQYTDALGGNVSPVVLQRREQARSRIAFVTYYKGEYGIHTLRRRRKRSHTVATRRLRRARPDHRLPGRR